MATFATFATWADVLAHVRNNQPIYYHAPFDYRACRIGARVIEDRVYVEPLGDADPFEADADHLTRFRRKVSE